jgi:hypothetical protein
MADKADILTTLYTEERVQARQAEDQRATLTNIIIIVVGAGLAFITNNDIGRLTLAVSIPMTIIGLYGAVSTAKYFERWFRHWNRAYAYQAQLFDLHPDINEKLGTYELELVRSRRYPYEREINERFPRLSALKLYRLWIGFHCAVAVGGVLLTLLVFVAD